jgi:hypothetical protein
MDAEPVRGSVDGPTDGQADGTDGESGPDTSDASGERRRRWWVRPLVIAVVSVVVGALVIRFVGAIDWSQVVSAWQRLTVVTGLALLAGLLVRQVLNAVPLSRFVPGLGLARSMQNDVAANVTGTIAPPPADVVVRVAMFRSWRINPVDGMAGVTLNMLVFYAVRFLAPALGLLVLAYRGVESAQLVSALLSAGVAVAIIVALVLVARGDAFASWLGRTAGRIAARIRDGVDPESWAGAVVDFRGRMAQTLRTGLAPAMAALVGMVLADSLILLMALRFVGVGPEVLSFTEIVGGFLLVYPLTLMPLFGLGVLDAALVAAWTAAAGLAWEAEIVAALVVWRSVTILGPLSAGAITLAVWRRRHPGWDTREGEVSPRAG